MEIENQVNEASGFSFELPEELTKEGGNTVVDPVLNEEGEEIQQDENEVDYSSLDENESARHFEAIKRKKPEERTEAEIDFFEAQEEKIIDDKYNALLEKPEEELTDDEKTFLADNKPLTPVESIAELAEDLYEIEFDENTNFENNEDGIAVVLAKVAEKAAANARNEFLSHPHLSELHEYIEAGGQVENYLRTKHPDVEYSQVEIIADEDYDEEKHPSQSRNRNAILLADFRYQGYSDIEAQAIIDTYEEKGIKGQMARLSQEKLVRIQANAKQNIVHDQKEVARKAKEDKIAYENAYRTALKNTKIIGGLAIPETAKDAFVDFMFKARKDSKIPTIPIAQEILYNTLNPESKSYNTEKFQKMRSALNYFIFNYEKDPEFISKVVERKAKTVKVKREFSKDDSSGRVRRGRSSNRRSSSQQEPFSGQVII